MEEAGQMVVVVVELEFEYRAFMKGIDKSEKKKVPC